MAGTYEIVQALNQAAANAFPGALDDEGKPREDLPIGDKNSGFRLSISANKVCVKYSEEMPLTDVQKKNFESDVKQSVADVVKYLKKEYKKIAGESLSLTKEGKVDILIQSLSRHRSWVQAKQVFTLGGMDTKEVGEAPPKSLQENIKNFIGQRGPRFKSE